MAPIPISARISIDGVEKATLLQSAVAKAFAQGVEQGLGSFQPRDVRGRFIKIGEALAATIEDGAERGFTSVSRRLVDFEKQLSRLQGPGSNILQERFKNIAESVNEIIPGTLKLSQAFAKIKQLTNELVIGAFADDINKVTKARSALESVANTFGELGQNVRSVITSSLSESLNEYVSNLQKAAKAEEALQQKIAERSRLVEANRKRVEEGNIFANRDNLDATAQKRSQELDSRIAALQEENRKFVETESGNFFRRVGLETPKAETVDDVENRRIEDALRERKALREAEKEEREEAFKRQRQLEKRELAEQAKFEKRITEKAQRTKLDTRSDKFGILGLASDAKKLGPAKITLDKFTDSIILATKRYGAFLVGGGTILGLITALKASTREALEFEKTVTRIQQVIGATNQEAAQIGDSIRKSAISTGVKATDIGGGVLTLAQAGFQDQEQLSRLSDTFAKIPLAPSFDGIQQSTEGLLAILGQFNKELTDTADIFDVVNQFANDFAIESKDIFEIVKRGGAAFAATGGELREFIALASLLRESTRESADTLGTFFKSGIAELFQARSKGVLAQLGVSTKQSNVGILRDLARALSGPDSRFSGQEQIDISRQLVGTRQFARLLALLRELNDPKNDDRIQKALANSVGSLDRAVGDRLNDVGQSVDKVKESFNDLTRSVIQNEGFKSFVADLTQIIQKGLELTKVLSALSPLIAGLGLAVGVRAIGGVGSRLFRRVQLSDIKQRPFEFRNPVDGVVGLTGDWVVRERARRDLREERNLRVRRGRIFQRSFGPGLAAAGFAGGAAISAFGGDGVGRVLQSASVLGAAGSAFGPAGAVIGALIGSLSTLNSVTRERIASEREVLSQREGFNGLSGAARGLAGGGGVNGILGFMQAGLATATDLPTLFELLNPFSPVSDSTQLKMLRTRRDLGSTLSDLDSTLLFDADVDPRNPTSQGRILRSKAETTGQNLSRQLRMAGLTKEVPGLVSAAVAAVLKQELPQVSNAAISSFVSTLDLGTKPIDEIKQQLEERGAAFANIISQITTEISGALEKNTRRFAAVSDAIRGISTNIFGRTSVVSSDNRTLLSANNLGNLSNRIGRADDISASLGDFFGTFRARVADELEAFGSSAGEGQDLIRNSKDFFENLTGLSSLKASGAGNQLISEQEKRVKDLQKRFGTVFDELFGAFNRGGDKDFRELIRQLFESKNLKQEIENILPDIQEINRTADAIRSMNEQINQVNDSSRSLTDALIAASNATQESRNRLRNSRFAGEDAATAASRFGLNRANTVGNLIEDAAIQSRRAQEIISGRRLPNIDQALATADFAIRGQSRLNGMNAPIDEVAEASFFLQNLLNGSKIAFDELNRAISQTDDALGLLESAAETSRNAFKAFDGELAGSSGAAGFSLTDFSRAFSDLASIAPQLDLSKVGTAAGIGQAGNILNSLSASQNERIQRLLQASGTLNLGGGVSGADVLGDFNRALNIPFLARLRSTLSGGRETFGQARDNITKELEALRKKADDDAKAAQDLRKQQNDLISKQQQVAELQERAANAELERLQNIQKDLAAAIALGLKDFSDINSKLSVNIDSLSLNIKDLTAQLGRGVTTVLSIEPLNVNIELRTNQFGQLTNEVKRTVYNTLIAKFKEVFADQPEIASKLNDGTVVTE